MTTRVTKDRTAEVLRSVRELTRREILVGIPESADLRDPEDPGDPIIGNAEIGYIHEFGAPGSNIPPRPHLVPGVESAIPDVVKRLEAGARKAIEGDQQAGLMAMERAGTVAASAVKTYITDGGLLPLAPATLARRRARGRTGEKPLIDTGDYRRSITYVVREKDDASS